MSQRWTASVLLTVGLLAAACAYSAWCLDRTVLNADQVAASARAILRTPPVQDGMVDEIKNELQQGTTTPLDPALLDRAAKTAVTDPRFVGAFSDALVQIHQVALGKAQGPIVLSNARVTDAVRAAIENTDPTLAAHVPVDTQFRVNVATDNVPNLSTVSDAVHQTTVIGAILAVLLIAAGVILQPRRSWVVGKIGRWLLGFGAVQLIILFPLADFILPRFGEYSTVAGTVIRGTGSAILAPALAMVVAGGAFIVASSRAQHRASLAAHEPVPVTTATLQSWQPRV